MAPDGARAPTERLLNSDVVAWRLLHARNAVQWCNDAMQGRPRKGSWAVTWLPHHPVLMACVGTFVIPAGTVDVSL
eukprot:1159996-Pelagomonas_calceolata.AAC.7